MTPTALPTKADVAREFGVSTRTIQRWVAEGKLRALRLSHKTVRFQPVQVSKFKTEAAKR